MTKEKTPYERFGHSLIQEFRFASGHEYGVHGHLPGHKRPEGFVLVTLDVKGDEMMVSGHTSAHRSAAKDALIVYDLNTEHLGKRLRAKKHPILFAMVSVGVSEDDTTLLRPSDEVITDLRNHPIAKSLRELHVYPGSTDDDGWVMKLRGRSLG